MPQQASLTGRLFPPIASDHDIIDVLICILRMFLTAGLEPRMWNRDVSKAFRRCLISVEHPDLSWVVSAAEGLDWVSQHLGPLFGAASAAYAWHRFGILWPGWSWHLSMTYSEFFAVVSSGRVENSVKF